MRSCVHNIGVFPLAQDRRHRHPCRIRQPDPHQWIVLVLRMCYVFVMYAR